MASIFQRQLEVPQPRDSSGSRSLGSVAEANYVGEVASVLEIVDLVDMVNKCPSCASPPSAVKTYTKQLLRAMTNWYRIQHLISHGDGHLLCDDQLNSYHLLFDWLTAAYSDPSHPMAVFAFILKSSPTLQEGHRHISQFGGLPAEYIELWSCIERQFEVLGWGGLEKLDLQSPEPPTDQYCVILWQLFCSEFCIPIAYDMEGIQKDELASIRLEAAMEAYCLQVAAHCQSLCLDRLGNIDDARPESYIRNLPKQIQPGTKVEVEGDYTWVCSAEASDTAFLRNLDHGPQIRACPWLDPPRAEKNDLEGWPEHLWDLENSSLIRTRDLKEVHPEYTALSHTWGRWKVQGAGYTVTNGWKYPIPYNQRFDVSCLVEDLQHLRKRICTKYIWLDLLCIPQGGRNDTLDASDEQIKLQEIARQGYIFRNATRAIAWLHDVKSLSCLEAIFQLMAWSKFSHCHSGPILGTKVADFGQKLFQQLDSGHTGLLGPPPVLEPFPSSSSPNVVTFGDPDFPEDLKKEARAPDTMRRPPNSWFTSLWTLQELCLRPDMLLATSDWHILSLQNGQMIPLNGFLCMFKNYHHCLVNSPPQFNAAIEEISHFLLSTGIRDLHRLSRIQIITLGDRRECTGRRAEAIMAAVGATRWFDKVCTKTYNPELDLILEKYPRKFVDELRHMMPGEFFAAYYKAPWADPTNVSAIRGGCSHSPGGVLVKMVYGLSYEFGGLINGSMLPFSKMGHFYFPNDPQTSTRVIYQTHSSVQSWGVKEDGLVKIEKACILSSSKLRNNAKMPNVLLCNFHGFSASSSLGDNMMGHSHHSGPCLVDMHSWTSTRDFEVHIILVMERIAKIPGIRSNDPPRVVHFLQGVVLRGMEHKGCGECRHMIRIGNFSAVVSGVERLCIRLPEAEVVDWTVL